MKNLLFRGDCLEVMKRIPSASIDMILCDLPYGTTQCKWDTIIPLEPLWEQYRRITKDNGAILLHAQTPFDKVLGASNLPMLRYEWIWEKGTATGHLNAKKAPMKAHENILVFYKRLPKYNPQKTDGHKPVNAFYTRRSGNCYGEAEAASAGGGSTERYPRSVLRFSVEATTVHPTQKPVALMEYLIRTYTDENAVVLDNCMGSGTTGVACMNLGRRFIGIEKDDKYFAVAKERITSLKTPCLSNQ